MAWLQCGNTLRAVLSADDGGSEEAVCPQLVFNARESVSPMEAGSLLRDNRRDPLPRPSPGSLVPVHRTIQNSLALGSMCTEAWCAGPSCGMRRRRKRDLCSSICPAPQQGLALVASDRPWDKRRNEDHSERTVSTEAWVPEDISIPGHSKL